MVDGLLLADTILPQQRPEYSVYGSQKAANLDEYFICTDGDSIFEMFYSAVAEAR